MHTYFGKRLSFENHITEVTLKLASTYFSTEIYSLASHSFLYIEARSCFCVQMFSFPVLIFPVITVRNVIVISILFVTTLQL